MRPGLTKRQAAILDFLRRHLREHGYPPTVREIADYFHLSSPQGAKKHLDNLQSRGYIQRRPGSPRAIEIKSQGPGPDDRHSALLPILGRVGAGNLNLALQERIGTLCIDPSLTGDPNAFALQVKGDSMSGAGILDGDYAIVKPQCDAANGEIVVARVGDEATVKYFYKRKHHLRLKPANPRFKTILVTPDLPEFMIIGKVVGIVRKL